MAGRVACGLAALLHGYSCDSFLIRVTCSEQCSELVEEPVEGFVIQPLP